jgi:uncharacterized protein
MEHILIYAVIGFFAQMIDGSLGMGYKTSSTTFLISSGVPPVIASASVHTGGIFTSAVSGYSHFRFGNLDRTLMRKLAVPGILGGIIGALVLTNLPTHIIKPLVATYLLAMGIRIILKSLHKLEKASANLGLHTTALGLIGGFFDSIGGGGWGPIVTSSLVMDGHPPRYVIGSVNIAEFFVTMAQAMTFVVLISHDYNWNIIAGLIIGGVLAAPMAAYLCRVLPADRLMTAVGILIVILSSRTLFLALFPGV